MVVFPGALVFKSVYSPFPWQCYIEQQSALQWTVLPDAVILPPGTALRLMWMQKLLLLVTDSTAQMMEVVC